MTNRPVADHFDDINARLQEIEAENEAARAREETVCFLCGGSGWMLDGMTPQGPVVVICEACGNPEGNPCP